MDSFYVETPERSDLIIHHSTLDVGCSMFGMFFRLLGFIGFVELLGFVGPVGFGIISA